MKWNTVIMPERVGRLCNQFKLPTLPLATRIVPAMNIQ